MSNIFNDRTDTELNERTINFQNLSVADTTIPILGLNNNVSGQVAGIAGLDLISKDTLDDVKDDILGTRLKNLSNASITTESVATINGDVVSSAPIGTAGKDIISKGTIAEIQTSVLETRLNNLKDVSITIESVPTITNNIVSSAPIGTAGKDIISKGTIAEIQTSVLETRLINLKDISITSESLVTINENDVVSVAPIGTAGKNIIAKDTITEIQTDLLQTRLINLKDISITSESVPTINGDTINSIPVSTAGKNLLNITSIGDLRSQILETSEEAVVFTADTKNEINFYTGTTQTASDLRLQLTNSTTFVNNTLDTKDIKVDNANKIISNNYAYRDDVTNPIYLTFDNQHAHFTSPDGIRINQQFQIDSQNGSTATHLFTTAGNKPLHYTTKGTGNHVFYTGGDVDGENATEILNIKPDSIDCSKVLKTIASLGDKIHFDTTSKVYTSPGQIHYYTSDRQVFIWAKGQYVMLLTDILISLTKPVSITGSCTATSFIGPLTGNAVTATKIESINNNDIVQLTETQTLTNKTLTSPIITGNGAIAGVFTGPLTGNAETSTKIASINNNDIVQLTETQTLTNKTLTSPIITGTGAIAGVFTGDLTGNADTSTKIASINNSDIVQLTETQTLTNKTLTSPIITGNGAIAGVFTGDLTGNSDTSTKIASINNSDIVQLTETQTLTNKTLTSPIITGTGAIAGVFTGNLTGNADTSTKIASINNSDIVQLDSIQNLNNKTLTNPSFTGTLHISSIYFRVVDLPSTPTQNDYDNVYTLDYFYSLPLFIDGLTSTYTLNSLANMTNGYDWTNLDLKGMILDFTITSTINGTMFLKHTSDDGARVYLNSSSTPLTTTTIFGTTMPYPAAWTNQAPTDGYATFSITAGTEYRIRVQYVESTGGAACSFEWNTSSSYGPYSSDWSSLITNNNNIGSTSFPLNSLHTNTGYIDTLNSTTIDFPETLADKVLLYGTTYKLSVSDSSIDYITGDKHTFKQNTNDLLKLNNTNITTYKSIIPDTTGSIDIGSIEKIFNNGYINTIKTSSISPQITNGDLTLSGNGSGKVIVNSNLQSNLLLTCQIGVVGTTTAYGKFGVKSDGGALYAGNAAWDNNYSIFGNGVDFKNASNQYGLAVGIGTNSTDLKYGVIKCIEPSFAWRDLHFSANGLYFDQSGTERMRVTDNIVCSSNIIPNSTFDGRTIGNSSNLWGEIFCENSTINTSDRTKKKDIDYDNMDKFADELLNLKPCSYKMINGSSNRTHMGLISQDLEGSIFEQTGAFIKSKKTKTITETILVDGMKSSHEKQVEIPNEYNYGLRYSELISPLLKLVQKQQKQIDQLVARIDILESGTENELSFI